MRHWWAKKIPDGLKWVYSCFKSDKTNLNLPYVSEIKSRKSDQDENTVTVTSLVGVAISCTVGTAIVIIFFVFIVKRIQRKGSVNIYFVPVKS